MTKTEAAKITTAKTDNEAWDLLLDGVKIGTVENFGARSYVAYRATDGRPVTSPYGEPSLTAIKAAVSSSLHLLAGE